MKTFRSASQADRTLTGGEEVKRRIALHLTVLLALTMLASLASAQPYPGPSFTNYYSSTTLFNGVPVPVGSIIRAYDPNGVLSGVDTVGVGPTAPAGFFGFMNVYGDQPETPGLDEGAVNGDAINFTINGRTATVVSGDPTFTDQAQKELTLSASMTVSMTVIEVPQDIAASFNRTVRFTVKVRNDGDGEDFYHISTSHSDTAFHTIALDSFVYADPGDTVSVDFDVHTPFFTSTGDTVDVISFTVNSGIDETQSYSGNVSLYFSITDVPDGGGNLPRGFALNQNYPNPFNPTTTISFSLPRSSDVRIDIIDILGRTVDSRELGNQSAGDHAIEYDGSSLSSGVYFYRLVTDYAQQSKKMLLVK